MTLVLSEEADLERVAIQAVVLTTLRDATGGAPVWPGAAIADLHLSENEAAAAAQAISEQLHIHCAARDLTEHGTVDALLDRILERS